MFIFEQAIMLKQGIYLIIDGEDQTIKKKKKKKRETEEDPLKNQRNLKHLLQKW
jgi:hypothetical protein